ncbi:hypothetical protein HanPSC8_Chr08g0310221 [Helianthus annuus]|nr:hypothetical protein HanPSC8_Chr08g0310221 [Helianthus annuus]
MHSPNCIKNHIIFTSYSLKVSSILAQKSTLRILLYYRQFVILNLLLLPISSKVSLKHLACV